MPGLRPGRRRAAAGAPTSSAGSWSGPASCRSGIVLALVGAPFFIALVRRRRTGAAVTGALAANGPAYAPSPRGRPAARPSASAAVSGVWRPRIAAGHRVGCVALVLVAAVEHRPRRLPDRPSPTCCARWSGGGDARAASSSCWSCGCPGRSPGCWSGPALGVSGALTQTFARNPLASPDILGVTAGAAPSARRGDRARRRPAPAAAAGALGLPVAALVGGLVTAAARLLAWRRGIDGYRLVLVGIGRRRRGVALTVLAAHPRRDLRRRRGLRVAHRLAQRPRLGARRAARAGAGRAGARSRCCWPPGSASCSSATTPPAGWACGSTWRRRRARPGRRRAGRGRHRLAPGRSRSSRSSSRRSPPAGRLRPPAAAGLRPVGAVLVVGADLVARTVLAARAARRHRHRRHRRPYLLWLLARGSRRSPHDDDIRSAGTGATGAPGVRLAARDLRSPTATRSSSTTSTWSSSTARSPRSIGPNGCGKSTLLRALGRLLPARRGQVLLDGGRSTGRRPARSPRCSGVLPQAPVAPEGLTVADLVARGRHPHQTWLRQWSRDDEEVVAEALALDRHGRPRRAARRRAVRRAAPARLDLDGAGPGHRPAAARRADHLPRPRPPDRRPGAGARLHAERGPDRRRWCCTT